MTLLQKDFVLIRHGQTDANRDKTVAGRIEAELTAEGQGAAAALSRLIWDRPLVVFASPQKRAQDTAKLAFPTQAIQTIEGLRERNWGIYEGGALADLPAREASPEGGETWAEINARVEAAIRQCQELAGDALPVLVAHSGVIRSTRYLVFGGSEGPSAMNTTPYLYSVQNGAWTESIWPL